MLLQAKQVNGVPVQAALELRPPLQLNPLDHGGNVSFEGIAGEGHEIHVPQNLGPCFLLIAHCCVSLDLVCSLIGGSEVSAL